MVGGVSYLTIYILFRMRQFECDKCTVHIHVVHNACPRSIPESE
jgi:hypothetical protein